MDKNMKIAIILTAMDKASSVVSGAVSKSQKRLQSLSTGLNKFGNTALIAGTLGTAFFASTIKAAEESETANRRLQQVFKSMGQDYTTATKDAESYASKLQMQIGIEDELIMAVQAKMATFENAANAQARANGIFNRATLASFDMQADGFGEATMNAVQLGKALQDPITGINALRRSGISFTDAEKKKIAQLVKTNQIFKAQDIIMKSIEKQVGGVAEATVNESTKMKVAWGEVQEQLGKELLPYFIQFGNYIIDVIIPAVTNFIDKHPVLVKWLAMGSVALLVAGAAAKILAFSFSALSGVLGFLSKTLMFVGKTVVLVGRMMLANPIILIMTAIGMAVYLVIKHWSKIVAFFKRILNKVGKAFSDAWAYIKSIPERVWNWIVEKWNQFTDFFKNLWGRIKAAAHDAWDAIGDAIIAPIIWVKQKWQDFKDWFKRLWGNIKGFAKDLVGGPASIVQKQYEKQLAAAQKSITLNPAAINTNQLVNATINTNPSSRPVPVRAAGNTSFTYAPVINNPGGASPEALKTMMQDQGRDFLKKIEEAQRKANRAKF